MSDGEIGRVKGGQGNEYHVKWNGGSVQVKKITGLASGGWQSAGHASSAGEAMRVAEAYVYNK